MNVSLFWPSKNIETVNRATTCNMQVLLDWMIMNKYEIACFMHQSFLFQSPDILYLLHSLHSNDISAHKRAYVGESIRNSEGS